jgi:hypothetical protein
MVEHHDDGEQAAVCRGCLHTLPDHDPACPDAPEVPWLVLFDCGHTRHPEPTATSDGPPPIGWAGWCPACSDFRTTVDVVVA